MRALRAFTWPLRGFPCNRPAAFISQQCLSMGFLPIGTLSRAAQRRLAHPGGFPDAQQALSGLCKSNPPEESRANNSTTAIPGFRLMASLGCKHCGAWLGRTGGRPVCFSGTGLRPRSPCTAFQKKRPHPERRASQTCFSDKQPPVFLRAGREFLGVFRLEPGKAGRRAFNWVVKLAYFLL
jgi:hypothetical protein